jgi:hypothetical protein
MFAYYGFESSSSRRAAILASDMACGVVRQGFGPGLQVFLRECILVAAQIRSCLQGWMHVRVTLYCSQMGKRLSQRVVQHAQVE